MSALSRLPTLAQARAKPSAIPKYDPRFETRLAAKVTADKATKKRTLDLQKAVWQKYGGKCHVCGIRLVKSLERRSNRGEIHHRQTRGAHPELKESLTNLVLLCATHHELAQRHLIRVPK